MTPDMTSDNVPEPLIGLSLGRYQILALLGQDALGFSYKAHDVEFQREVAVKVVDPRIAEQPDFEARFSLAVRTAIGLRHSGLIKVFDLGQARSLYYVVTEYIPGGDLSAALQGLRAAGKWIALSEAVQLVRHVCLALDYARRNGVPHRSLEPSHILLKLQPGDDLGYQPVLADLGLAELRPGEVPSLEDFSPSELTYLSPEQVKGEAPDARSSVYSSGVLLYQLAVARPPFRISTAADAARYHAEETPPAPRSIRADLPGSIEQIIVKALEKDPARRFATAGEMAQALAQTLPAAVEIDARPETQAWAVSLLTQLQPGGEELPGSQTPATIEPELAFKQPPVKGGFTRADGSAIEPGQIRFSAGERVGLFVEPAQLTVVPGNSVALSLIVFNRGATDDHFTLSLTGVPANWIPEPLPAVELASGAQAEVKLSIRPPRSPQSRAGRRALTVRVASQNAPDEVVEERVTLNIVVYSEFSSDLRPQRVRAGETARVVVHNHGNTPENFRLACFDPEGKLAFEPAELSLTVPEGQGVTAEFIAGLRRRRLFGSARAHGFLARIVAQSGQAQTHTGEVISAGLIPAWIVSLVLLVMFAGLVVGAAALIFSPPAPSTPAPPSIDKAFSNVTGLNSTLTFTLTNPNATVALTGVAFTDTLPTTPGALVVANPSNAIVSTGCGSPSFVADAGSGAITFVNGTLAGGGTCTVAVDVTVPAGGTYYNATGRVTAIEGGTGDSASAILVVGAVAPPSIAKSFSLTSIPAGGVVKLTFTIVNPNLGITLTGVTFTDVFPATPGAMVVVNPPNPSISVGCGLPAFTPEAGSGSITFSNGTIAGGQICTVAVDVTAPVGGTYTNASGAVVSANGGTGNTATAVLTVGAAAPPSIAKSFAPSSIVAGMKSTLT
ncbi:MAG TPA: protein kinase, partial [Anaerolineae bacterium]|nr:protein kinase [Anaerolineae bacterium]